MQAKRVRFVYNSILPHELSLKNLHGFLTALLRPRLGLIVSCPASASSMLPRPRSRSRENCLTDEVFVYGRLY